MLSLALEPMHGYAIMKEVVTLSEGRGSLNTGTLYGVLKRLLVQGWIERIENAKEQTAPKASGRTRKAYTLTKMGPSVLESEIARIENLAILARLRTDGAQV